MFSGDTLMVYSSSHVMFGCLYWFLQGLHFLTCNTRLLISNWKVEAPSKLLLFGQRLFQNILPSRIELSRRHAKLEVFCPHYFEDEETVLHLFNLCPIASALWSMVLKWMDVDNNIIVDSLENHYFSFSTLIKDKVSKILRGII